MEATLEPIGETNTGSQHTHISVMPDEVMTWLAPKPGQTIIDGTCGAGGHSILISRQTGLSGLVIGLDRDQQMLELAQNRARREGVQITFRQSSYADAGSVCQELGLRSVNGLLVDLGLSSDQLAWTDRGFSFQHDGPLDMRFDTSGDRPTAAEIVNEWTETELADIFYHYGEERHSRRLARPVVNERRSGPIQTTAQLADLIRRAMPGPRGRIDPATRVFQGLRIAVNDELGELERLLEHAHEWIAPGGRFVLISFHSLEDRMVKHRLREMPQWDVLTRKVVTATEAELAINPRSRSAKLRAYQRTEVI